MIFDDRRQAGKQLAGRFVAYSNRNDVVILAIKRNSVAIAFEMSIKLNIELDIFFTHQKEIKNFNVSNDAQIWAEFSYKEYDSANDISLSLLNKPQWESNKFVYLNSYYRSNKYRANLEDKLVILVDDGTSTCEEINLVTHLVMEYSPRAIIAASPVFSNKTFDEIENEISSIICIAECNNIDSVNKFYKKNCNISNLEIGALIERTNNRRMH